MNESEAKHHVWERRNLIDDILARSIDGLTHLGDIVDVAERGGARGEESIRLLAIGIMARVLIGELMVVGQFGHDGFFEWELQGAAALEEICDAWDVTELRPPPGEIAWFKLTDSGRALGEKVLTQEGVTIRALVNPQRDDIARR